MTALKTAPLVAVYQFIVGLTKHFGNIIGPMKLTLSQPKVPISELPDVTIPSFTILTGLNGAGKTQLLAAIDAGRVEVEGVPPNDIHIYDARQFRLRQSGSLTGQQLEQMAQNAWQLWTGQQPRAGNWRATAQQIYGQVFQNSPAFDKTDTDLAADVIEKIKVYEAELDSKIFSNRQFKQQANSASIADLLRAHSGPAHTILDTEFLREFRPSSNDGDMLSAALASSFTKYKVDQTRWCYKQLAQGAIGPIDVLETQYEDANPPPWKLVNKLLTTIHQMGGQDLAFNFRVSEPSGTRPEPEKIAAFSFQPVLIDISFGHPRTFEDLSSGEQALLSLAISIFRSQGTARLPKLLLLDEVDASLHPSMSKALIGTLQEVFVKNGTDVILATHSPSTVALSPEDAVVIATKTAKGLELSQADRGQAVQILSEGFIALDNSFLNLRIVPEGKIGVLSEGKNVQILEKVFAIHGIDNVVLMTGREHCTGHTQLKAFYDLLGPLPHTGAVLCVWDCDCLKYRYHELPETNHLFRFVIPHRPDNLIADRGIENAFPESVFEGYSIDLLVQRTGEKRRSLDGNSKSAFANFISSHDNVEIFSHFDSLVEKIRSISLSSSTSTEPAAPLE